MNLILDSGSNAKTEINKNISVHIYWMEKEYFYSSIKGKIIG